MVASNPDQSKLCHDSNSLKVLVCGFAQEPALPDGDSAPLDHLSFVLEGDGVPPKDYAWHFDWLYPTEAECRYSGTAIHSSHCIYSRGHFCSSEQESDSDSSSCPGSPINVSSCKKRHPCPLGRLTPRESSLKEAWDRKRELHDNAFANFKEFADVRTLGRSSSDCREHLTGISNYASLERSKSDCGKPNNDYLITPSRHRRTWTRNFTDDDFEELKGFLDLGFRFDQSSIPDLCEALPALEAVSAVTQTFHNSLTASPDQSFEPSPTPSWSVTKPGDTTEEMKDKLRHWAQAVACSARLYPSIGELTSENVIQCTI